jgi:hypothetical protein
MWVAPVPVGTSDTLQRGLSDLGDIVVFPYAELVTLAIVALAQVRSSAAGSFACEDQ